MGRNRDEVILKRDYLRKWHKEKKITFTYAADHLDISLRYYMRLLDGVRGSTIPARIMRGICKILNVSGDDMINSEVMFQEKLTKLKNKNVKCIKQ